MRRRLTGKFWPAVRARIWEVAEQLHAADFYDGHEENITPSTRQELREAGYFYRAKCLVLREINRETQGSYRQTSQDEEDFQDYMRRFKGR